MTNDFKITSSSGKVYNGIRAFHIAMGHAVRNALLKFYKDVKQYVINEVKKYYDMEFHGSEYYDNTYGMIVALENSDDINGAITRAVKGSWEGNGILNINIDWSYLEAHSNGYGKWGVYSSLDGENVTDKWEDLLQSGLPKGILERTGERHPSFNLQQIIQEYVDNNLDNIIQEALRKF